MDTESKKTRKISFSSLGYIGSMSIVCLLLGLIISTQFKNHVELKRTGLSSSRQLNELVMILKETQVKKTDLENQLSALKGQIKYLNNQPNPLSLSRDQFKKIYQIAGIFPVKGSGIVIEINDSRIQKSNNDKLFINDGLVHSDDLLKIINELKASGAEAISVNDQRIITSSEIITVGNNIVINQTKLAPTYIIKAVGSTESMISGLKIRGGIAEYLEVFGIKVNIYKKSDLTILPFHGKY